MKSYKFCIDENKGFFCEILPEKTDDHAIHVISEEEALENGEACIQLLEGTVYEYRLSSELEFQEFPGFIQPSGFNTYTGRFNTGISVGTVTLKIVDKKNDRYYDLFLEICSKKLTYRDDYRYMLEAIAEKCTDLLMINNATASGNFTPDYKADPKTSYQRFAFVKSFFDSEEFDNAVFRILQDPVTDWIDRVEKTDIRRIRRLSGRHLRQISGETNRFPLPEKHSLRKHLQSIPAKLENVKKEDTTDVHENRFVSFVLNEVLFFCSQIRNALNQYQEQREYQEVIRLEEKINAILKHDLFRGLSDATYIPFNSPILQRREGYREILKFWLQFELAAQLIWRGGDEVYRAGKRDVAVLYEYWLFFQLLDVITELFEIQPESVEKLFEPTGNGLNLKLKAGRHLLLKGVYRNPVRDLCVEYHYNRVFSNTEDYRGSGSWSEQMRPDFTLSLWPEAFTKDEAEQQELMVHIHFDAKYKVRELTEIFGASNEDFDRDKEQEKSGIYQRGDLLKMHAYKDAIKHTDGAYVLYPGNSQRKIFKGFHEIIPGLGAFAIRPDTDHSGIDELKDFLGKVVDHTINRASKRETVSYYKFNTYRQKTDEVKEKIPEYYNAKSKDRMPPPDTIHVLVGFYKSNMQLKWILRNGLYNVRREGRGQLTITDEVLQSRYLLLHTRGMLTTGLIFSKSPSQPRIETKVSLSTMNYPSPGHESYYLFKFEPQIDRSFNHAKWDIRKLKNFQSRRQSGYPFTTTLAELMSVKLTKESY